MKKIFTLIATAMLAVGANAQDWKVAENGTYSEGAVLLDNDNAKITTANNEATAWRLFTEDADQKITEADAKVADYTFQYGINVRVDAAPNATNPTGTAHAGSNTNLTDAQNKNIAVVVEAKQNTDVVFYVKVGRKKTFDCYDQTTGQSVAGDMAEDHTEIEGADTEWVYAAITFQLTKGCTYTFYTKGGTTTLFAIDTQKSTYVEPTTVIYANAAAPKVDGFSTMSYADGAKVVLTGNADKTLDGGSNITIDGKDYKSTKVSNGAANTFYAPEGKKVYSFTIYSYVNKDAATGVSYWAQVGDKEYTAEDAEIMQSYKNGKNPDKYVGTFPEGLSEIVFKNKGEQACFVLEVNYNAPTGISAAKTQTTTDAIYNLAGQKVDASYKGIVIQNGKKFVQK